MQIIILVLYPTIWLNKVALILREVPFSMRFLFICRTYEGLAYYVYVSDSYGSTIITDTTDIILSFNDNVISSGMNYGEYVSGFPKGSWRMISLPTYLDSKSLEDALRKHGSIKRVKMDDIRME